uniref:Uncharacterized protein n=1 Tax=Triticum urartu TaxID=4572 RepID=A0A8R7TS93_TRIUA
MSLKGYHEASLHPPAAYDAAAAAAATAAAEWDWGEALLDRSAYMVDKKDHKKNHTSACHRFRRSLHDWEVEVEVEVEMQVSLFMAPPPRVSYFCCSASCTDDGDDHGEQEGAPRLFVREPWMIATEGDLALFTLCHGHNRAFYSESSNYDYFLYQAAASLAGSPELTRLPRPQPDMLPAFGSRCFPTGSIGVVRYRSNIPEDDDAYRIAALAYDYFDPSHSGYYLCTYDSKDPRWRRTPAASPHPPPPDDFLSSKVITIRRSGASSGSSTFRSTPNPARAHKLLVAGRWSRGPWRGSMAVWTPCFSGRSTRSIPEISTATTCPSLSLCPTPSSAPTEMASSTSYQCQQRKHQHQDVEGDCS